ncbi:stage II sporulation protein P [Paenibacillus sp. 481]|uniref:stage II sporulation protein P n=1 Tax=Paenibacillus sp. 481 TaxID=2835869 RepID=UPI001E348421|nr:stage II sporulation protein P [Paenibacillus sp. 481]UHA74207.1 stage II sporulation protein P [Paenibacillus sp. 481]
MFKIFNVGKMKRRWIQALVMGRTFVLLAIGSAVFFVIIGLGNMMEQRLHSSPISSMKGFAASLSSRLFVDMMAMELPHLPEGEGEATISSKQVAQFMFRMITNVNLLDPKSLLASELPGLNHDAAVPLRLGVGNLTAKGPEDYVPLPDQANGNSSSGANTDASHGSQSDTGSEEGEQRAGEGDTKNSDEQLDGQDGLRADHEVKPLPDQRSGDRNGGAISGSAHRKSVFIYHSHNRESWNPVLQQQSNNPSDSKKNITIVGKRLQEQLEKRGVGAVHSDKDYFSTVKGYNWNYSYRYSKRTVKQAMSEHDNLQFFFDIHRDAARRSNSTVEINGKSYAQVYFVIGHRNPKWRENEKFASDIHEKLEKRYPGISRGIWGKSAAQGNGEYNQSLSPHSVVVEIGGIDNTLEESYRTVDVMADLIAEVVHSKSNANPVNKPIQTL